MRIASINHIYQHQLNALRLQPSTLKDLCAMYNTTPKTFKRWILPFISEIGVKNGRYFSILQVSMIMKRLGMP